MKRRTTAYASIAILLAIVVLVTGCNPSASKQEDAATTMMRAMSQVAASKNYSSGEQNVNYTADDGSKITGKMTIDSNGEIVAANLTITYADGTQGPNLILATDGTGKENVTIDDTPVRNPIKPISKEQAAAMAIFLEGFEEAYDELQEYFTDDDFCEIINDIVMPALKNTNYDIQDSAAELLAFLLKCSVQVRKMIPELVTTFKEMIFSSKDDTIGLKWSGVKGLSAIIHSTVLFDTVPDYVYDSFCALSEAQEMYSTLEPTISMTFSDFWSIHEENLMPDVAEALTPFRDQVRPSYFC